MESEQHNLQPCLPQPVMRVRKPTCAGNIKLVVFFCPVVVQTLPQEKLLSVKEVVWLSGVRDWYRDQEAAGLKLTSQSLPLA